MANRFGRNSGNGNVAWMDVVSYQGRKKMHARKNLLGKSTTPDLFNDRFVNGINA